MATGTPNRTQTTTMEGAARIFPRFLDLPWELREEIWELAVSHDLSGAHFFTTTEYWTGSSFDSDSKSECIIIGFNDNEKDIHRSRLLIPRSFHCPNGGSPWTVDNPSAYMLGGMWTAC